MRVNLNVVSHTRGSQTEGTYGPLQVGGLVRFIQGQQLANGWLIDLHDLRSSGHEICNLIAQNQRNVIRSVTDGLVITDKRPCQHGHRPGEHSLDGKVSHVCRCLVPLHRHRLWPGDITVENRRPHAAGTIALDPAIGGGKVAVQLLREVLHHVVALRFTVNQHIEPQFFLLFNGRSNFSEHCRLVVSWGELSRAQLRTCTTNAIGLREGTDCGGRQRRQVKGLSLSRLASCKRGTSPVAVLDCRQSFTNFRLNNPLRLCPRCQCCPGLPQHLQIRGIELAVIQLGIKRPRQKGHLGNFLIAEGQPLQHLGIFFARVFRGQGVRDM